MNVFGRSVSRFFLKMSILLVGLVAALLAASFFSVVGAQTPQEKTPVTVQVFVREGCQHCADEEAFLAKLQQEDPTITVEYLRLEDHEQRQAWLDFTERTETSKVTPLTIVGTSLIIGFGTEDTTGESIKSAIATARRTNTPTSLEAITAESIRAAGTTAASTCPDDGSIPCAAPTAEPLYVTAPIIGKINVESYPLFFLSAVLGFIDGFNPCAMWVLVTFLMILFKIGDRRKMFVFAGVFILAESIMYYAILMVWMKAWDFVRLDAIVTPIVGLVAIGGGAFFLWEWWKNDNACKITSHEQQQRTKDRIQNLVKQNFSLLTLLGILGLAFSVNVIEFACSIGIPQTFTKILDLNGLNLLQSQFFLLIYILMYMVDDFIVFGLALYAFDKLGISTKYVKVSNLVGGVLMIVLGLILIFNPNILVL